MAMGPLSFGWCGGRCSWYFHCAVHRMPKLSFEMLIPLPSGCHSDAATSPRPKRKCVHVRLETEWRNRERERKER